MFMPASEMHGDPLADENRDPQRLLFVGKVCGKKGVPHLVSAVNQVEGFDNLSVNLVGGFSNPEEHARIEEQVQASGVPVAFAGKVPQDELIHNYQHSGVFVLPSLYEGLPLVLIEAMACGLKTVCTDLPGIRPWLDRAIPENGTVFVAPPRMYNEDEPYPEDLPAFEARLALGIEQAQYQPLPDPGLVTKVSWDSLCQAYCERWHS
jgi:glycosyltransferase involved in cell wall biosynthesis